MSTVTFPAVSSLYRQTRCEGMRRKLGQETGEGMKSRFMKSRLKMHVVRKAIVVLCGGGLAVGAAMPPTAMAAMRRTGMAAQQDAPPPPPAEGQQQGQQQGPPPPPNRAMNPEHRVEQMQRRLNLTPEQTAQVRTILAGDMEKMEALRANAAVAAQDRRAQMEAMRRDMQGKIRAVLTPDQQAKFDAMLANMRMKERERRGQAQGGESATPPPPPASPQP